MLASQKYCGRTFEYTTVQIKQALTGNCHAEKTVAIYGQINPRLNFNLM